MPRRWWLFAGWLAMVATIIVMADIGRLDWVLDLLRRIPMSDKVCHFFNQALNLRKFGPLLLGSLVIAIVLTAEEISQRWVPGRTFDYGDMAANIAGCVAADLLSRRRKG